MPLRVCRNFVTKFESLLTAIALPDQCEFDEKTKKDRVSF